LRGDILDVFPINSNVAVRIEWFDNEVDAVRSFDVNNQRSLQALEEIKIAPLW
jgi:transcription-repair coupling factor (superfamily II helicase)